MVLTTTPMLFTPGTCELADPTGRLLQQRRLGVPSSHVTCTVTDDTYMTLQQYMYTTCIGPRDDDGTPTASKRNVTGSRGRLMLTLLSKKT